MSPTRPKSAKNPNRQRIVDVARRLFYTKGYGQTSLGDLAKECGIPKGNFYYHFRSKDDVLLAVLEARRTDVDKGLASWRATIATPAKRLHRVVDMLINEEEDLAAFGCPMGSLITELGKGQPDLQREAFGVLQSIVDFAAEELIELGHPKKAAREQAVHLIGRCQGVAVMTHGLGSKAVLRREAKAIRTWLNELLDQTTSSPTVSRKKEPVR
ncbi:MAG: TetR/AcrR family transcriptional regulator [Nannocystales bacterium]